jgi:hypothetical protein
MNNITLWKSRVNTHLQFLQRIASDSKHFEPEYLSTLVALYTKLLPLVSKHGSQNIWIPESVMWIFHCHLLHPLDYMRDCREAFGHLVVFNPQAHLIDQAFTRKVFQQEYGHTIEGDSSVLSSFKPGIDLVHAAMTQKTFTSECLQLFYMLDHMEQGIENYRKFIHVVKKAIEQDPTQTIALVPTKEIDLFWHTHMRYPAEYLQYVKEETGYLLNHEDGVDNLNQQFEQSAQMWTNNYNEPYESIAKKAECCCTNKNSALCTLIPVQDSVLHVLPQEIVLYA